MLKLGLPIAGEMRQIGLCQHDMVGKGELLPTFQKVLQRREPVQRIEGGDDAGQPVAPRHDMIAQAQRRRAAGNQAVDDGGGVRKAGRFDDDALNRGDRARSHGLIQIVKRGPDIAGCRAAKATGRGAQIGLAACLDEVMIDRDRAEFVHDHGGSSHGRIGEESVQQCRLARPQKAGEQRHRNAIISALRIGGLVRNGALPGHVRLFHAVQIRG